MINVYIVSGFLGAGKTTFISKLLKEKKFEKVMLLENEFGEVGVDGAFFDSNLQVQEINNGCICCSLKGDFASALEEIEGMGISDLVIEPSGVGKLSDIISVIADDEDFRIVSHICIVDVKTCAKYHLNFGEYFNDQVISANAIILSHTDVAGEEQIAKAIEIVKELNDDADIIQEPIENMNISELLEAIVKNGEICLECLEEAEHHHHHHHHEEGCQCECCCHEHEDEHHHHHHHHHDHDDEVFKNLIIRPDHIFTKDELENVLNNLDSDIIRAKGYVHGEEGTLYFNYVLNESTVYYGDKKEEALVSIIGTTLDKDALIEAFYG